MVVGDRHDDDLVGAVLVRDRLQPCADLVGRARGDPAALRRRLALALQEAQRLLDRRDGDQPPAAQHRHRHAAGGRQPPGLLLGVRGQRPRGDRDARRRQPDARVELALVVRRDLRAGGVDEVGERVGEAELRRPDAALRRGAQQPRLGRLRPAGQRARQPRERMVGRERVLEVAEQLGELLGEVVGRGLAAIALERVRRHRVGARRAAQPEVDPAGMETGEEAEPLGDLQRAVVREHHAAAADADPLGGRRDRPDQHLGRRAREHRAAVVLGDPVAVVSQAVGVAGEVERVGERVRSGRARGDRGLVEHAEPHRPPRYAAPAPVLRGRPSAETSSSPTSR